MLSTFNFDVDVPFLIVYVVKRSDEDEAIPVADGEYPKGPMLSDSGFTMGTN